MAINLSTISIEKKRITNFINSKLQDHFDKEFVDLSKRTRVEADLEKWRPDIVEIWEQKKDKSDRIYSIYFDDEFVCSFGISESPAIVEVKFLRGITSLFEDEKIYLDENEYAIQAELRRLKTEEDERKIKEKMKTDNPDVTKLIKELENESKTAK